MRFGKTVKAFLCVSLVFICLSLSALAIDAEVYADKMKVYSKASTASQYYIGALSKGTEFEVLDYNDVWAKVRYKGRVGYAQIADMKSHVKTKMYVKKTTNVYKKASSSSAKIASLGVNTVVYVVGWNGSYYLVDNGSGATGYILKSNLSSAYVSRTAYTNCAAAVYKSASTSAKLCTVGVNTKVTVIGESGSFYKVKDASGKNTGYVKKSDLSASKTTVKKELAYTNCSVAVYASASASGKKVGTLPVNSVVYITGESGGFYKVMNAGGSQTGYIQKGKLSASKTSVAAQKPQQTEQNESADKGAYNSETSTTTMPAALKSTQSSASAALSNEAKLEYVIYFAQEHLGCRYSASPNNSTTFDCLTLLYTGFKKVGVTIPNTAYLCGYTGNYETIKNISDLKRGDIVCFDTNENDSDLSDHVGIYLGGNRFIHASSGAGMVVVSRLDTNYYKEHFFCGRRILK